MNKKSKTVFVCSECGYISLRWLGKCTECGAWDSFEEQVQNKSSGKNKSAAISGELIALDSAVQVQEERIATNINEL
ncbi:MAG: hypothetical protein P8X42_10765, partial [Calditrichaceae bacterium]